MMWALVGAALDDGAVFPAALGPAFRCEMSEDVVLLAGAGKDLDRIAGEAHVGEVEGGFERLHVLGVEGRQ